MKAPEGPVCIIGITGTLGARVAELLVPRQVKVRGVAREPERFQSELGVELVVADVARAAEAERAVAGCSVVYLTPAEEGKDPISSERLIVENILNACRKHSVKHLLVHTILEAGRGGTGVRMIDTKKEIERLVEQSDVPFTILRPGWFLENLEKTKPEITKGRFSFPLPAGQRFGAVSADDVAEIAVSFILKGPQGRAFDLHLMGGIDAGTLSDVAGRVLGRNVAFSESKVEEFLAHFPLEHQQRELQKELFHYMRDVPLLGKPEEITRVLPEFQYTSAENFLRELLSTPTPEPPRRKNPSPDTILPSGTKPF
jgi:uncharacterized protein YbjT (DUF2867 family)